MADQKSVASETNQHSQMERQIAALERIADTLERIQGELSQLRFAIPKPKMF